MTPDGDAEPQPRKGPGHGDHWLAALDQDDPRMAEALAPPLDAPDGLALHRSKMTPALDMVQVTLRRRLVTAYPEPRATTLTQVRPRELNVWETRVEGWLTVDHPDAGALTLFPTDLAKNPHLYASASPGGFVLEIAALAYFVQPVSQERGMPRLASARSLDERFLPDDYWFEGLVEGVRETAEERVLDLRFQGDLRVPVVAREGPSVEEGDYVQGYLWLTCRWPDAP